MPQLVDKPSQRLSTQSHNVFSSARRSKTDLFIPDLCYILRNIMFCGNANVLHRQHECVSYVLFRRVSGYDCLWEYKYAWSISISSLNKIFYWLKRVVILATPQLLPRCMQQTLASITRFSVAHIYVNFIGRTRASIQLTSRICHHFCPLSSDAVL